MSTASNENTLIDLVTTDTEIVNNSLKLAPVNSSNIYARRHSAHACTATEDRQLTVDVSSTYFRMGFNMDCEKCLWKRQNLHPS